MNTPTSYYVLHRETTAIEVESMLVEICKPELPISGVWLAAIECHTDLRALITFDPATLVEIAFFS